MANGHERELQASIFKKTTQHNSSLIAALGACETLNEIIVIKHSKLS